MKTYVYIAGIWGQVFIIIIIIVIILKEKKREREMGMWVRWVNPSKELTRKIHIERKSNCSSMCMLWAMYVKWDLR